MSVWKDKSKYKQQGLCRREAFMEGVSYPWNRTSRAQCTGRPAGSPPQSNLSRVALPPYDIDILPQYVVDSDDSVQDTSTELLPHQKVQDDCLRELPS